jgi:large conductance mechanosensitive channel
MGGSISKMVTSLVNDIANPLLGLLIGAAGNIKDAYFVIGSSKILWGSFVSNLIDFLIIALVVYCGVKILGISKLDKKKDNKSK